VAFSWPVNDDEPSQEFRCCAPFGHCNRVTFQPIDTRKDALSELCTHSGIATNGSQLYHEDVIRTLTITSTYTLLLHALYSVLECIHVLRTTVLRVSLVLRLEWGSILVEQTHTKMSGIREVTYSQI
jgi:hypothetical protein